MAWPTDRVLVYDRSLAFLFELAPDEVMKRERTEELNGTHELAVVSSRVLHEGYRLLTVDNMGRWREHVVYKPDEGHEKGDHATGTYVCMWSLQYDLTSTVQGNVVQPGMGSSCSSRTAVAAAIGGQSIWTAGDCDVPSVAAGKGVVMVGNNAWNRLKQVVGAWGGEVDAEITVSSTGVVTRKVVLRAHLGSTKVTRRFDWGEDLTSIHRTPDPGPYFCRILPFGRGQREYAEDDETEFDWPSDVTEEPYSAGDGWVHDNGSAFVRDPEAETVFRTADGHGGWHYPTKEVKYDEDDPELLLNEATADIHNHTRPSVGYEADVLQFAEAGMDVQGVALGDDIQCVDYGFNPDAALRVQGRVTRMVVNELAPKVDTKLTIGNLGTTFAGVLKDLIGSGTQSIASRLNHIEAGGALVYLKTLIDQLNSEINATGGYVYVTDGDGLLTYDRAVSDPTRGTEATKVVEIKGGSIRIADSRTSSGDWNWKTVFVSGHILAELVTAAHIVSGYIGSPDGDVYLNFEEHIFQIGSAAKIGSTTAGTLVSDTATAKSNASAALTNAANAAKVATNYLTFNQQNGLDVGYQGTSAKTRINGNGVEIFDESGTSMTKVQSGKMRLGESSKTRAEIDWHSLQLIDKEGSAYMYVSDFRDADGYATMTDTLVVWRGGSNYLTETAVDTNYTIKINGVDRTSEFKRYTQYFYYDGSGSLAYGTVLNVTYRVRINRTKAYTLGLRKTNSPLGIMSLAEGYLTEASGAGSHAEGYYSQAAGIASHAEGGYPTYTSDPSWTAPDLDPNYPSKALGVASHAESGGIAKGPCSRAFFRGTANGFASFAHGINALADGTYAFAIGAGALAYHGQFVYGSWNVQSESQLFTIGCGSSSSSRATAFYVSDDGDGWFKGSCTATSHPTSSDRRLKKHVGYIGNDMCDFVRRLKPVRYRWANGDDGEHYGFYAQDVADADPYRTSIVSSVEDGNGFGFDPLTLDYNALIAPLVAYTQQLEKRIDEQQETIEALAKRIEALEGGAR
jgi:hypothetical protein